MAKPTLATLAAQLAEVIAVNDALLARVAVLEEALASRPTQPVRVQPTVFEWDPNVAGDFRRALEASRKVSGSVVRRAAA